MNIQACSVVEPFSEPKQQHQMPLLASATSGSSSTPAPIGTHPARCCRVIDMGTQKDDGKFGVKISPKVMITWELPTEMHTFKEEKGPEPFVVSKEYTLNLGEKSNLRKDLESWRGRAFTEEELKGFNIGKLIGAPCLISVIHKTTPGGVYARVSTIAPMVKGMQVPPAILPPIVYDVDSGRNDVFNAFPDWIKNKIQQCLNWQTPEPEPQGNTELYEEDQFGGGEVLSEPF